MRGYHAPGLFRCIAFITNSLFCGSCFFSKGGIFGKVLDCYQKSLVTDEGFCVFTGFKLRLLIFEGKWLGNNVEPLMFNSYVARRYLRKQSGYAKY